MCIVIDLLRALIEEECVLIKIEFNRATIIIWTSARFNWISTQ